MFSSFSLNTTSSFPSSLLSNNSGCFLLFKTKMPDLSYFSQNERSTSSTFQAFHLISICYKGSDLKYKYLGLLSCAVITDEKARTFPDYFMMLTFSLFSNKASPHYKIAFSLFPDKLVLFTLRFVYIGAKMTPLPDVFRENPI